MNEIIRPGAGVLFMKVGKHAQESLADIVARKTREIEDAGHTFWGYGGNTCHPTSMVQPFARDFAERNEPIHLCMEAMESGHMADPLCAAQFSPDGLEWGDIDPSIEVRGSRFALKIRGLREVDMQLPLDQTRVAVGNSQGRLGSRYISGRVDKGCLTVLDEAEQVNEENARSTRPINLVAELMQPYAVFLRNYR